MQFYTRRVVITFRFSQRKESAKHKVGGDNGRGGLLLAGDRNVMHELVSYSGDATCDAVYLNVMKKLRESNLLRKKDIKERGLLYWACNLVTSMRFDYLIDWCPEGLKTHTYGGFPLIHAVIDNSLGLIECFSTFLEASLFFSTYILRRCLEGFM
jgi:hypothetical protein